jgi:16S rRNA (cytidine1402-2'-O)-methyltransferase
MTGCNWLAATGVRATAVVRLLAAGAEFAAFCFGHKTTERNTSPVAGNPGSAQAHRTDLGTRRWRHGGAQPSATSGADPRFSRKGVVVAGTHGALLRNKGGAYFVGHRPEGLVLAIRQLRPRRLAAFGSAYWILELPEGEPLPRVGNHLVVVRPNLIGMPGRLVMCATPIGNLDDAGPRLAKVLSAASIIYAEDTRRSRVLLRRLGVDVPTRSFFVGNEQSRAAELANRLRDGDDVALITDAGTPSISDPGLSAVQAAITVGAVVTVVPGASAITAALTVSGLPADRFVFEGFLPRKVGRRESRLKQLAFEDRTMVLFAVPSRVVADLTAAAEAFGEQRDVVVCRELTKLHEEVFRGTLASALARWTDEVEPRGEFTLVIAGASAAMDQVDSLLADVIHRTEAGDSLSVAVRDVADISGASRRALYEYALRARDDV